MHLRTHFHNARSDSCALTPYSQSHSLPIYPVHISIYKLASFSCVAQSHCVSVPARSPRPVILRQLCVSRATRAPDPFRVRVQRVPHVIRVVQPHHLAHSPTKRAAHLAQTSLALLTRFKCSPDHLASRDRITALTSRSFARNAINVAPATVPYRVRSCRLGSTESFARIAALHLASAAQLSVECCHHSSRAMCFPFRARCACSTSGGLRSARQFCTPHGPTRAV